MAWRNVFLAALIPFSVGARELDPWYGNELELELRSSYHLTHYDGVDIRSGSLKRDTTHHQLIGSGALNAFDWAGELELGFAGSNHKPVGFEFLQVTARHKLLNDTWQDFISLAIGATVRFTGKEAREDLSSYFHGRVEAEAHFAVGKEIAQGCQWCYRNWLAAGVGIADRAQGWAFGEAVAEFFVFRCLQLRLFAEARDGFGDHSLDTFEGFETYSPFSYRWAKAGGRLTYITRCCGAVSLEIAKGFATRNAPEQPFYLMTRWTLLRSPV